MLRCSYLMCVLTLLAVARRTQRRANFYSFNQIARMPRPGLQTIGKMAFTPDGSKLLYLKSPEYGDLKQGLFTTDVATGETKPLAVSQPGTGEEKDFSLEEKLRRERARIHSTGITSFEMAKNGRILVPMGDGLYIRESAEEDAPMTRLFDPTVEPLGAEFPILDARISTDGSYAFFVWSQELYCVPADGSLPPKQLTFGARGTDGVMNGLADFLAQEELNRYDGYWPSSDGSQVAYEFVDESHIPQYRIMHQGSADVGETAQEDHRYPFAGASNPKVKLYLIPTGGDDVPTPIEFDLTEPFGDDFYLARVDWMPDGALIAQVLNREQTDVSVLRLDPAKGEVEQVLTEHFDAWANVHDMFKPIGKSGKFLWASERTGFRHLYVYDPAAPEALQSLTEGNWTVESVVSIDEDAEIVYFLGTSEGSWLEQHLFKVSATPGTSKPEQITSAPGFHSVVVDKGCNYFLDAVHSVDDAPSATLRELDSGRELHRVYRNEDPRLKELELSPPEFLTFPSADGKVTLQAAIYKPDEKIFGPGPYPTVVSCYGGPHVQMVQNSWRMTCDMRAQALRSRGFLVLTVDNRGSSRRGLEFEAAMKRNMGSVEVLDQVAGVEHCVKRGLCDPEKVGIYGWSYGGYLSAMCLAKSRVFKCAVVGAPVTSWDGYDTCYTERYMGTPQNNPEGYKSSNVMNHVKDMSGDLLLVHGLLDENVHFRHTARLINALIAEQKTNYQLLPFPNERHSPRSEKDREYMERRIFEFLENSLQKL